MKEDHKEQRIKQKITQATQCLNLAPTDLGKKIYKKIISDLKEDLLTLQKQNRKDFTP